MTRITSDDISAVLKPTETIVPDPDILTGPAQDNTGKDIVNPQQVGLAYSHASEYLVEHALRTVWCSPFQGEHFIFELSQLTHPKGVNQSHEFFDRYIKMPDKNHTWHIFMIGGNFPINLGLPDITEEWVRVTDWMNLSDVILKFYNQWGLQVPLADIYYCKEYDDNLLIAIPDDEDFVIDVGVEPIYLHIRNSRFYREHDELPKENRVDVVAQKLNKSVDITPNFQLPIQKKLPYLHVHNGKPSNLKENYIKNDYLDTLTDASIIRTEYHRVGDMVQYESQLDKLSKYLLHLYGGSDIDRNRIIYRDDIELYLVKIDATSKLAELNKYLKLETEKMIETKEEIEKVNEILNSFPVLKGCYYHRNEENSVRHVTNQAYGIPVKYVHEYIRHFDPKMELDKWYLKVIIRDDGINQTMYPERNHVYALNSLPIKDRIEAMVSTESTIDFWKARELEKSPYNFLMRAYADEITSDIVLKAYGYDETVSALADPNVAVTKSRNGNHFLLPVGLGDRATIYEYDVTGRLLGWYHHLDGFRYLPVNKECTYIEAIAGLGSDNPDITLNPKTVSLDNSTAYRLYRQYVNEEGKSIQPWKDVTEELGLYKKGTTHLKFNIQQGEQLMLIGDNRFLCRELHLKRTTREYYQFTLTYGAFNQFLLLPFGKIAVWVNGYALSEGIDFIVDFPRVTILAKKWLETDTDEDTVRVLYRCMGFPDEETLAHPIPRDRGFTINDTLSLDTDITLHQSRISRFVVDGGCYHPNAFTFNHYGEATLEGLASGKPYCIDDHYIPLRGFGGGPSIVYDMYREDRLRKKQVQAYLEHNLRGNKPPLPEKVTMPVKHHLYSPFLSGIIKKVLDNEQFYKSFDYTDKTKLNRLVRPFKHLLQSDPAYLGFDIDFVEIHPRPFTLKEPREVHYRIFAMFEHITKMFLKHPIDLTPWFKVTRTREKE